MIVPPEAPCGPDRVRPGPGQRGPGGRLALGLLLLATAASIQSIGRGTARAETAWAERSGGPFAQGRSRAHLSGGTTSAFGTSSALVLAGGFGYFVLDGLEVGVDAGVRLLADPFLAQVGPQVRYLIDTRAGAYPYAGVFHRHWFLGDGLGDMDSVGARVGVLVRSGGSLLGLAWVDWNPCGMTGTGLCPAPKVWRWVWPKYDGLLRVGILPFQECLAAPCWFYEHF